MTISLSRRMLLLQSASGVALALSAPAAFAVSLDVARDLVDRLVADVNAVIASGKSESGMLQDFETIFNTYADVPSIAANVLGNARREASREQITAFIGAFRTYIARKYGRRFREFIGGRVEVRQARDVPNGVEVETSAVFVGRAPFRVDFVVSDGSGQPLFFNIIIEGINMILSERTEILAMLDQRGGDFDALIAALPQG